MRIERENYFLNVPSIFVNMSVFGVSAYGSGCTLKKISKFPCSLVSFSGVSIEFFVVRSVFSNFR